MEIGIDSWWRWLYRTEWQDIEKIGDPTSRTGKKLWSSGYKAFIASERVWTLVHLFDSTKP